MFPQGVTALVVIVTSFALVGCWSSRELNEAAIVAGVGFDRVGPDEQALTVQIVQPGKLLPQARGQAQQAVYIEQQAGKTTFEAIRNFNHKSSRKLFWSHCQLFVIGSKCARENVTATLDWFYRNQEFRPLAYIAMSETSAQDILKAGSTIEPVPAYQRADEIKTMTDTSDAAIVRLKEYMEFCARPEAAAYMPVMKTTREDTVSVTGTAVFLHDQLAGLLDHDESKGLLFLVGQVHSGPMVVQALQPSRGTDHLTTEIIQASVKQSIRYQRSRPVVVYHIQCVVDLSDDPDETAHSPEDFHKLEQRMARDIQTKAMQCVTKVKSFHADIIGVGEFLERKNPRLWHTMQSRWDTEFPTIPVQVEASVHIRHEGLIKARK